MRRRLIARFRAIVAWGLLVAQMVLIALILKDVAYVTTFRLLLDQRTGGPPGSAAAQRFDVEGRRVLPKIITRGADAIQFISPVGRDSVIESELRPATRTAWAIRWRDGGSERTLAAGVAESPTVVSAAFPTGIGRIELVTDGPATWVDPRIVRNVGVSWNVGFLAMFGISSVTWRRYVRGRGVLTRVEWFRASAMVATAAVALLGVEAGLRIMGEWLPPGIINERHNLGEVTRDDRWDDSPRYDRRLRPHLDLVNEWSDGDIIRMGYVPAIVGDHVRHRFRFQTDAEGFRNPSVRDRFDIAALGDSFTDAMTVAADQSWPAQLEQRLGVKVQNYGTATYGPQQELLVLTDFVVKHRPSRVVLAYFAGNDLFDAEAFDDFTRSQGRAKREVPGWPINDIVSRIDTWFVTSAVRSAATWVRSQPPMPVAEAAAPEPLPAQPVSTGPSFDRGMFSVPMRERPLRWALMPPYLNTMRAAQPELEARRGWALTRDSLREMQRISKSAGAEFTVMFLPFKSQVYWPLLERTFSREALVESLAFYLPDRQRAIDVDAMGRNRLAQNRMLRRFCEEAGIPFVDTTDALQARVDAGENVYFPSESHLNETGQAVVAETLAAFLGHR